DIVARCDLGDPIEPVMKDCDVIIDFSHADAITEICSAAQQQHKSLVIGTTGHSQEQRQLIERTAHSLPIVFASNFSVGLNVYFGQTEKEAGFLGHYFYVEIVKPPKKRKKNAPSATAKTLCEILKTVYRIENTVPIQSIREGDVVGEHTVIF